ncbi:unnamed protein product, partial [marine sediment metagenome]
MTSKQQNIKNKHDWQNVTVNHNLGRKVNVHKFNLDKVTLNLIGDIHYGSKFTAKDELLNVLDWCNDNDNPMILMGDIMETATRDSVGAGVYEQDEIVQRQLEHMVNLFKPLNHLILGSHVGNHEARVYNKSGLDLAKIFAKMINVPYLGVGAAHIIRVGNKSY